MRFLLCCPATLKDFRQNFLKLCAVHTSSPPKYRLSIAPYGFAAFSALLVLSDSRSFMRALCS